MHKYWYFVGLEPPQMIARAYTGTCACKGMIVFYRNTSVIYQKIMADIVTMDSSVTQPKFE